MGEHTLVLVLNFCWESRQGLLRTVAVPKPCINRPTDQLDGSQQTVNVCLAGSCPATHLLLDLFEKC